MFEAAALLGEPGEHSSCVVAACVHAITLANAYHVFPPLLFMKQDLFDNEKPRLVCK